MSTCCGRAETHVKAAKAEIARLARLAARTSARGRSIDKLKAQIALAKSDLARSEEIAAEHECEVAS